MTSAEKSIKLKTHKICQFCGGVLVKKYSGIPDRLETTKKTYSISECTSCKAAILNPAPTGDLSSLYPAYYLSSEEQAGVSSKKFDLEKWYRYNQYNYDFNLLERASGYRISSVNSFVDIGCGSGERVTFAYEQGCARSFGVDKFDFAKSKSKKEVTIINSEILKYKPNIKFQVASLFHVLEHLEHPIEVLSHIKSEILEKNGYLIIQVPNYGSIESRFFRSKWFGLDVPRHFWHFNEKAIKNLLEQCGYTVEGIYQLNAPLHPVTIVPSINRELDIQRIWIKGANSDSYKKIMTVLWAGFTLLTIPLAIAQNLFKRSSMLTVVASNNN